MTPTADLGYPGSAFPLLPLDAAPALPPGCGAIAMHTRCPPAARRFTLAPIVGVDGQPAMYGFGRALIVVAAGERLVEVQYIEPQASTLVTVDDGAVVPLEYVASRDGRAPGSLGAPGSLRPAGRPPVGVPLLFAAGAGVLAGAGFALVAVLAGAPAAVAAVLPVAAVPVVAGAVFTAWWRRGRS